MNQRERDALDRHITGNYGEDQLKDSLDGYIEELLADRKQLAGALLDLIKSDGSTRLMRIQIAKRLLIEIGFGENLT
jgi:hypothetical protein